MVASKQAYWPPPIRSIDARFSRTVATCNETVQWLVVALFVVVVVVPVIVLNRFRALRVRNRPSQDPVLSTRRTSIKVGDQYRDTRSGELLIVRNISPSALPYLGIGWQVTLEPLPSGSPIWLAETSLRDGVEFE